MDIFLVRPPNLLRLCHWCIKADQGQNGPENRTTGLHKVEKCTVSHIKRDTENSTTFCSDKILIKININIINDY